MDKELTNPSETRQENNDGIDFIKIIVIILRWKWFIVALVIIVTAIALIIPPSKRYSVRTSLVVGTVGDYAIQPPDMIAGFVKTELFSRAYQNNLIISTTGKPDPPGNFGATIKDRDGSFRLKIDFVSSKKLIDFSVQASSPEDSVKWAQAIGDFIINKHRPLYENLIKQVKVELMDLRRMTIYVNKEYISTKLKFSLEKYPTDYIFKPVAPHMSDSGASSSRIARAGAAFISSLIAGIFLSLLFEYIIAIRRKTRERLDIG